VRVWNLSNFYQFVGISSCFSRDACFRNFACIEETMSSRVLPAKYTTVYTTPKILYIQRDSKFGLDFLSLYFKIRNWRCQWQILFLIGGQCWNEDETHAAHHSPTQVELTNECKILVHSRSHFALNWHRCTAVRYASVLAVVFKKFRTSSFKWYLVHSHTLYSSGNIDVRN
jgi:hypothetical protein